MSIVARNKRLRDAPAKVTNTPKTIEARLNVELATLPARYGFGSVAEFFAAVTKAQRKLGKHAARSANGGKGSLEAIVPYMTHAERSRLTIAGIKAARRRGTRFGRPPLDPKIVQRIQAAAARMGHQVRAIARKVQASPSTVCRVLARGR